MSQTIPVRTGEELNIDQLEKYLRDKFFDLPDGKLQVEQFGTGASNLTYALHIGDWEVVLRRPPHGPVAPRAHDMEREFNILNQLHENYPIAPKPILFSNDESIVGKPFFIMERKHGILIDSSFPKDVEQTFQLCQSISEEMVNKLVQLHSLPFKGTVLEKMSKPIGFMERQVHSWINRYSKAKTDEIVEVEPLIKWLVSNIPATNDTAIIHYDYKMNNALFANDLSEMVGLFDWEMTTIGDPLADLGIALCYWVESNDSEVLKDIFAKPAITVGEHFYTRRQFAESYAQKSGRELSNFDFYLSFAYFRFATILQQIYLRYKNGQTDDQRFEKFNDAVKGLMIQALQTAYK